MQDNLNEKHKREMQELKDKYERMLEEMRNNASSDKEFLQMELQKRIRELEEEIATLKQNFADAQEKLMAE